MLIILVLVPIFFNCFTMLIILVLVPIFFNCFGRRRYEHAFVKSHIESERMKDEDERLAEPDLNLRDYLQNVYFPPDLEDDEDIEEVDAPSCPSSSVTIRRGTQSPRDVPSSSSGIAHDTQSPKRCS
ncbi:hypothetical protein ACS0TY_008769 [Phlomoides rotata]